MADMSEEYGRNVLRGMARYTADIEPWVFHIFPNTIRDKHTIEEIITLAKRLQVDAIIGQFYNTDNVELFARNGILAIAQDFKQRIKSIPSLTGAYYLSGQMGAQYFLDKGFRNFGFYGIRNIVWSEERYKGFKDTIGNSKKSYSLSLLYSKEENDLWHYDFNNIIKWIEGLPKPVAIMACDDNQAYHIAEACLQIEKGCSIPNDIAILGVDNDETMCTLCIPNLSSIYQAVEQGGYDVAMAIDMWLKTGVVPEDIIVNCPHIVERQSTDICAVKDKHISLVLKYIHDNIDKNTPVSKLTSMVPLSRRLLEIRFREEVGRSIKEYIINLRINKMCHLLYNGMRISDAAAELGVPDVRNLSRTFKRIKGITPSEYIRNIHKDKA